MMMGQWMQQGMMPQQGPEIDKDLYRNQHGQPWGQQMQGWRQQMPGWGRMWGQQRPQSSGYQLGDMMQGIPEQGMPGMRVPMGWQGQQFGGGAI